MSAASRRGVLGGVAALLAGSALPVAASAATGPDAELIRLCAEFDALEHRVQALHEEGGASYIEDDRERDEALEPLGERQRILVDRIFELRATTLEGLRALARATVIWGPFKIQDPEDISDRIKIALLRSLAGDIWVNEVVGLWGDGAGPAAEAKTAIVPDADIIADSRELETVHRQIEDYYAADREADSHRDPVLAALCKRQGEVCDRLIFSTAVTRAGRIAKARGALVMAQRNLDGSIDTDGMPGDLAYSTLADIVGVEWDVYPVPPNGHGGVS